MNKVAALDPSTATGTGGEAMSVPFGSAMDTCGISLEKGLATILAEPSSGIPAAWATASRRSPGAPRATKAAAAAIISSGQPKSSTPPE